MSTKGAFFQNVVAAAYSMGTIGSLFPLHTIFEHLYRPNKEDPFSEAKKFAMILGSMFAWPVTVPCGIYMVNQEDHKGSYAFECPVCRKINNKFT